MYSQKTEGEGVMYEYAKGNFVYRGNQECGSPIREIRTVSQKEADYWDKLEREIKRQERFSRKNK